MSEAVECSSISSCCSVCFPGRMDYAEAWALQNRLVVARSADLIDNTLLLLEHPPTFTIGRRGKKEHLLVTREALSEEGISFYDVDRGGDITYHGPGQLVGYPVISLAGVEGGVSRYLRKLEEVLIRALSTFGISAERSLGFTGVWVGDEKIAAIGVKLNAKRITSHGFALNVTTDVGYFEKIVPCGICGKGVTTIARILVRDVPLSDVAEKVSETFGQTFDMKMRQVDIENIMPAASAQSSKGEGCSRGNNY
jgi:lipoyl(octanoyl) transferase